MDLGNVVFPVISEGLKFHLDMSDYDPITNTVREKKKGWDFKLNNCTWKGNHVLFAPPQTSYVPKVPQWMICQGHTMGDWGLQAKGAGQNNWTVEVVMRRNYIHPNNLNPNWMEGYAMEYIVQNGLYYTPGYVTNVRRNWVSYGIETNHESNKTRVALLPSMVDTLGLLSTHSINADFSIYNGTDYGLGEYNYKSRNGNGTIMGGRHDGWYQFHGEIYQVRIYHRTLSKDEILYNQEQDKKRYGINF